MSDLAEEVEVKVATNAAQDFVESYYPSLNTPNGRSKLTSFYLKPSPTSPVKANITLNGNIVEHPTALQAIFENQVEKSQYDAQSFDCQVLNANYNISAAEDALGPNKDGKKMSILVMVSGSVKYWKDGGDGEVRGFSETFVLVPNWEAQGPKAAKGAKKWLIQSQNFRVTSDKPG